MTAAALLLILAVLYPLFAQTAPPVHFEDASALLDFEHRSSEFGGLGV